jgi:predicted DNA-binding transcriptional regulator YafY
VSERTIYRDMQALSESGVPVVALPGEGYELLEGFYLPPLVLTPQEASALFLGAQLLTAQATGKLPTDAVSALTKLNLVLPKATRAEMARLTEIIRFFVTTARFNLDEPRLASLQKAIREQRVVWLRYHAFNSNEVSEREIEPTQLAYFNGAWYVDGYCRLRQGWRNFRLERIDQLKLRKERFTPRPAGYQPGEKIDMTIRFSSEAARWVRERQHYGFVREEDDPDHAGVLMHYRLETISEIKPWLLSWGAAAEPLAPPTLREEIRQEIRKLYFGLRCLSVPPTCPVTPKLLGKL